MRDIPELPFTGSLDEGEAARNLENSAGSHSEGDALVFNYPHVNSILVFWISGNA